MKINVIGEELSENEISCYIKYLEEKNPNKEIANLDLKVDGEFIDMNYTFSNNIPFERIRRITGYLVGTVDRFNDAKKAEVRDRVTHGTDAEMSML